MMRRLWLLCAFLLSASPAFAQNIVQGGALPIVPGRVGSWIYNGILGNGEGAAGCTTTGCNPITDFGITAFGTPDCLYDYPTDYSGGYHQLCFGAQATLNGDTGAFITLNAYGGASQTPLYIDYYGTVYPWPSSSGGGNVTGPSTTTVGDLALWNNTNGTLLKDSSTLPLSMLAAGTDNAIMATNGSGAWGATQTLPSAVQSNITGLGTVTAGDINGITGIDNTVIGDVTPVAGTFTTVSATLGELYGPAGSAGHSLPQLVLNNEDNQTQNGAGGFIRFSSLNSSNNPINGVQLNGGLVSATAGDEMGDLDIAIYRDGTPQVVALSGPQGNSGVYGFWGPANNDAFVLGQSNLGWARLYMETQSQGDLYIDLNNANTSGRNWWIDSTGSGSGIAAGVLGFLDQSSGGGQFLLNSLSVPQVQWAAANSGGVEELGVVNTAGTTNSQAIVTASAGGNSTLSLTATYDGGAIIVPGSSETNLTIELGSVPLVITGLPSSSGGHALCENTSTGAVYIGAAGTGGC